MYMTIQEVAEQLKMKVSTVQRKIRQGLIPAQRVGGFNSPWRIDPIQLRQTMNGLTNMRRDMEFFDALVDGKTPSEQLQFDELKRRLQKLQAITGTLAPVRPLLDKFGAKQLDDLHPRYYASFRAHLMRLSRLGKSRVTMTVGR